MSYAHKLASTMIHMKALATCKKFKLNSKDILAGQLACVVQQVVDDKEINHLIPIQAMNKEQERQFLDLVDNVEELCGEYVSDMLESLN